MNMVRCMLFGMQVPHRFWPEAAQYAVHILNRCPTMILGEVTPSEKWSQHKPSVEHLRVFGCVTFALIPYERRTKLDEKSIKCVIFGVSKESKAYRLYNPVTKKIIISKDVKFDESKKWDWEGKAEEEKPIEVAGEEEERGNDDEEEQADSIANEEERNDDEPQEEQTVQPRETEREETSRSRAGRSVLKPAWMRDYVVEGKGLFMEGEEEELESWVLVYASDEDPEKFEEAVKEEKWRKAMEVEIKSIEDNETWELVSLPNGAKVIGVKWVYKTKLNEKGEVDKYKARLVAKGFHQTHGVDFEVFAPVARWDTIRLIIAIAAQRRWKVLQLDVKSAFLHGELEEDVYIEQPRGFELKENGEKVYKLRKALYGLRQVPRAWYSRIEGYFESKGFTKC